MTAAEFRATLRTLGWTVRGLARMLGRAESTVSNWSRPGYRVPDDVAAWLDLRLADHEAMLRHDPPPPPLRAPRKSR